MPAIYWVSYVLLWLLVLVQGFAFLEVLRQIGVIRKQLEPQQGALLVPNAVETGAPLPELSGQAATTMLPAHWDSYLPAGAKPCLLVGLTTHCLSCRAIAEELTGFVADVRDDATVLAFVEGPLGEAQDFIRQTSLDPRLVVIDEAGATMKRIGVSWNPGVVIVRQRRLGEAAIVNSVTQLGALVYGKYINREMGRTPHGVPE